MTSNYNFRSKSSLLQEANLSMNTRLVIKRETIEQLNKSYTYTHHHGIRLWVNVNDFQEILQCSNNILFYKQQI
jgi:hypothetical protein